MITLVKDLIELFSDSEMQEFCVIDLCSDTEVFRGFEVNCPNAILLAPVFSVNLLDNTQVLTINIDTSWG